MFAIAPGSASPVWPPAGVALAFMLLFGKRVWPGIVLGEVLAVVSSGLPLSVAVGMGLGNAAEALVAVWLIQRYSSSPLPFNTPKDLVRFVIIVLIGAATLAATAGVTCLMLGGIVSAADYWNAWLTWWLGDAMGMIIITPLVLSPYTVRHRVNMPCSPVELVLLLLATLVSGFAVFSGWLPILPNDTPLVFILLSLLVLAAFRLDHRGITFLIALIAVIAVVGTAQGHGPFVRGDINLSLLLVQSFIGIMAFTTLMLDSVLAERATVRQQLQDANEALGARVERDTLDLSRLNQDLKAEVAERRSAQQVLENERNFMSVVQDTVASLLLVLDRDGRVCSFNRACQEVSGYSQDEAVGRQLWELLVPSEDSEEVQSIFKRLIAGVFPIQHVNKWRTKDGDLRVTEWRNTVIRDDQGKVTHVVAAGNDITERQQAEAESKRLSEDMRLLLESTGEGIFGIDTEMNCTFINRSATEMLGFSREEMLGENTHWLIHHSYEDGSHYPEEACSMLGVLREGVTAEVDDEVLWTKEGTPVPVRYSASPVIDDGVITGAVVVFRDTTEARSMARRMDYLASHDPLTGLNNRFAFDEAMEHAIRTSRAGNAHHVLCYLDLDQFKVVNDTCGHVAGDELLRQLAGLLQNEVRSGDMLARLGGDEFGILLYSCTLDQAQHVLNGIRQTFEEYRFSWDGKSFSVGVSIGVVVIDENTQNQATALSNADAACYMAKDSGRNRVHVYENEDTELARRHGEMQWVARIHEAIAQDRFYLAYQTIVPVDDDNPASHHIELLIRLRDDDGTDVPPGAFLPAAERYGLAPVIDRWVISHAFQWLSELPTDVSLGLCTINLSGNTLGDERFLDFVIEESECWQIPSERICFELTETAAVANLTLAQHLIHSLCDRGFRFALDDFGSGMSSFAYLKSLPVNYLKIDGTFVKDVVQDSVDYAMVEAINQVGHVMGLETIAEFVENEAILDCLRDIGVDYAQGYGISRPRPLLEFS
jgi:diguanylate cyclase (GGDEF)-like protein/PAS domain S-box-containing protein